MFQSPPSQTAAPPPAGGATGVFSAPPAPVAAEPLDGPSEYTRIIRGYNPPPSAPAPAPAAAAPAARPAAPPRRGLPVAAIVLLGLLLIAAIVLVLVFALKK
jgi:hypothetical protein